MESNQSKSKNQIPMFKKQREHMELLIDLSKSDYFGTAAYKPIATLVVAKLTQIRQYKIEHVLDTYSERLDRTRGHT